MANMIQFIIKGRCVVTFIHRIGGNLKLLRESTNVDRKRLKIAFPIANCRFRLPVCKMLELSEVFDHGFISLKSLV